MRFTHYLDGNGTVWYKGEMELDWENIVQIAASSICVIGLKTDGTVETYPSSPSWDSIQLWEDIVQVEAGGYDYPYFLGLKADGTVVAAGVDLYDRCNVADWSSIVQVTAGYFHTVGLKADGCLVAVGANNYGQCTIPAIRAEDPFQFPMFQLSPSPGDALTAFLEEVKQTIDNLVATMASMYTQEEVDQAVAEALEDYTDVLPPTGAIHAHDNMLWSPNGKMVEVTISGYVRDELCMAKDGEGVGVSSAHLLIDGTELIPLSLDGGNFELTMEFEAKKGALYNLELYATDTNETPNEGLVDQTSIRVPLNLGGK